MIVDDSHTIRALLEDVLSIAGFDVHPSDKAEAALTDLKGGTKPDMIITDLNMGALNGIELIRNVRQMKPHQFTPILLLTTEFVQSKRDEAKLAGASGWLVKPFQPESLLQVVNQFLRNSAPSSKCA